MLVSLILASWVKLHDHLGLFDLGLLGVELHDLVLGLLGVGVLSLKRLDLLGLS